MKTKFMKVLILVLSAVMMLGVVAVFGACSNDQSSWNVSANDGGNVTASMEDNGRYGFVLKVSGSGAMKDFTSKKDAPWYRKSGRITDVVIENGVTNAGSNAFTDCATKSVVLPQSVTQIGNGAFGANTLVCAYGAITATGGAIVYQYSESKPTGSGNYWHYMGDTVTVWESKATKVLFIGNSFTYYNDIPQLFGQIATAAGADVVVESVTQGAWTLTKFADATDEYGKQVDDKLKASSDYDVVVLQEQSTRPLDNYNVFLTAAKALQKKIEETQTDCRIYLYATWGYQEAADVLKVTIPEMELQLRDAYERAAQEIGAQVSYVGKAFTAVYQDHKTVNDEYFTNPDKYANDPEKAYYLYYAVDNKHPSYTGSFLSACVHVATILGFNPEISPFTGNLDEATAAAMKKVASSVVFG